jgi:hypothetical protein
MASALSVTKSVRKTLEYFQKTDYIHFVLQNPNTKRLTDCFTLDKNDDVLDLSYYNFFPSKKSLKPFLTTLRPDNFFEDSSGIPFDVDSYFVNEDHLLSFYCRVLFKNGFFAIVDDNGYDKMREDPFIALEILYQEVVDLNETPKISCILPLFKEDECQRCQSTGNITLSDGNQVWCPDCCEKTKDVQTALLRAYGGITKVIQLLHGYSLNSKDCYDWTDFHFRNDHMSDNLLMEVSLLPVKCAALEGNKASFVLLKETFETRSPKTVGKIKAVVTLKVRTFYHIRYTLHIDYCDESDQTFSFALRSLEIAIKKQRAAEYFQLAYFLMKNLGFLPLIQPLKTLAHLKNNNFQLMILDSFDNDNENNYSVEPVHPLL